MQGIKFPDSEDAWQKYLAARLVFPVGTKQRKAAQFVKILRAGGNRRILMLDAAQMLFECYAEDAAKAADFAGVVRALVHSAEGSEKLPVCIVRRFGTCLGRRTYLTKSTTRLATVSPS